MLQAADGVGSPKPTQGNTVEFPAFTVEFPGDITTCPVDRTDLTLYFIHVNILIVLLTLCIQF